MFNGALREIRFANRHHAGRTLAERLRGYAGRDDVLVLGLPHGGAPVADEVVCAQAPAACSAEGAWYEDFSQTTDDEVTPLLQESDVSPGVGNRS